MSINSRSKGQRGEREIVKLLQRVANEAFAKHTIDAPTIERNQNQSWQGGYDIVGLDFIIAPEVKLCQTFQLDKWWKQAERQSSRCQRPVLFYRKNRVPWRVRLKETVQFASKPILIDISIDDFELWLIDAIDEYVYINRPDNYMKNE